MKSFLLAAKATAGRSWSEGGASQALQLGAETVPDLQPVPLLSCCNHSITSASVCLKDWRLRAR